MTLLTRQILREPYWPFHAAQLLGDVYQIHHARAKLFFRRVKHPSGQEKFHFKDRPNNSCFIGIMYTIHELQ